MGVSGCSSISVSFPTSNQTPVCRQLKSEEAVPGVREWYPLQSLHALSPTPGTFYKPRNCLYPQTLPTGLYTFLTLTLKWLCSQMSCSNLYASGYKKKVHGSHPWGYFTSSCKLMSEKLTCRIYYLREQTPCPQSYFRVLAHVPLKECFVDPVIEGRAGG